MCVVYVFARFVFITWHTIRLRSLILADVQAETSQNLCMWHEKRPTQTHIHIHSTTVIPHMYVVCMIPNKLHFSRYLNNSCSQTHWEIYPPIQYFPTSTYEKWMDSAQSTHNHIVKEHIRKSEQPEAKNLHFHLLDAALTDKIKHTRKVNRSEKNIKLNVFVFTVGNRYTYSMV